MKELGRLLLLLTLGLLLLLSFALIRFNPQVVPLQLGIVDLPRWPIGWLMVAALWTGILGTVAIALLHVTLLRLRLRRAQREQRALQEELRRARSIPLRLAGAPPAPPELEG